MKAAILSATLVALAATPSLAQPAYGVPLSADQAQKIVAAGIAEAKRRDFRMAFAIVEPSGALVLFQKMDDTQYGSIRVAQEKAVGAAQFRRPTKAFSDALASAPAMATLGVNALEGGLPIFSGGKIVGALGVSGGTSAQDGEVGQAALASAGFSAQP